MLDEERQVQLSETVPLGMQELPGHLKYRDEITDQQRELADLEPPCGQTADLDLTTIKSDLDLKRVGVTSIQPKYLFENYRIPTDEQTVIILVFPMDYDKMITAPSLDSATEILRSYARAGELAVKLTRYLRRHGHKATGHHPMGDTNEYHHLLLPPHAVSAGLGERGRTGLFIDYEYGPTVRLAAVTTSLSLEPTTSTSRGITEFCHRCKYCVRYCPPGALPDGTYLEQVQSGEPMDFTIDAHRCFQYFKNHNGCGRCIVHCILAEPDKETIARRLDRITAWYEKWVASGKLDEMYEQELTQQT